MSHGGVSVRAMSHKCGEVSHSGVSVGMMSHKCERSESEWSKCGKRKEFM